MQLIKPLCWLMWLTTLGFLALCLPLIEALAATLMIFTLVAFCKAAALGDLTSQMQALGATARSLIIAQSHKIDELEAKLKA